MSEIMSIREIKTKFDSEWVLLEDPSINDMSEIESGKVLYHGKDREEVYSKALELKPDHCTVIFTGTWKKKACLLI